MGQIGIIQGVKLEGVQEGDSQICIEDVERCT